jgi:hypothetical protein
MDVFLLLSAVAFGIGAVASRFKRIGGWLDWLCAGFCLFVLSRLFEVPLG